MRKSVRIYVSQQDIDLGTCGSGWSCPIHRSMKRNRVLKGKCFCVTETGVCVVPNKSFLRDREGDDFIPQIKLTENGLNFIANVDIGRHFVKPTHITLIDESGKYL
jgi:hypothetical protein